MADGYYEQRGKTWRVRYRDAHGHHRSKGGFRTKGDAKEWFRGHRSEMQQGVTHDRRITLQQVIDIYLAQHEASEARIQRLRYSLRHATRRFGELPIIELDAQAIRSWRKSLATDSIRFMATAALKQVLTFAVHDLKVMASSPAARIKNPDPGPQEEYDHFRDWAEVESVEKEMPDHYRGWTTVQVGTGLRPQEWTKLRWEHVDFDARVLRLPVSVVKDKTPARVVPIRQRAFDWLVANRRYSGLVFTTERGVPVDIRNYRKRVFHPAQEEVYRKLLGLPKDVKRSDLRLAMEEAGYRLRRTYDTRHTFATWGLRAGFNTFTLAKRMGTSVLMIDRTYGHHAHDSDMHERMLMDAFDGIDSLPVAEGYGRGTRDNEENLSGNVRASGVESFRNGVVRLSDL